MGMLITLVDITIYLQSQVEFPRKWTKVLAQTRYKETSHREWSLKMFL